MGRLSGIVLAAGMTVALLSAPAAAHKASDSYLTFRVEGAAITGQWDIALRDLDYAIGLDGDNDGVITWGELRARQAAIAAYALSHLTLRADGKPCPLRVTQQLVDDHSDGAYAVLRLAAQCPGAAQTLDIAYDLLFALDPQHRGLLRLEEGGRSHTAVLGPSRKTWRLEGQSVGLWRQIGDYFREGVWHICTGFDHMIFLCALLLPAVLSRRAGRWQAVASFGEASRDVVKIVTAFTLAHSITLSLAVTAWIALPSRLVESAIAASVVAAALNNLFPLIEKRLWVVAFCFGLVHGLGFAYALAALGLPKDALAVSLVSFNLGVEAGQLAIVGALLPLAYLWRRSWAYPRLVLGAGSLGIFAVASVWLIERSLNLSLFS